MILRSARLTRWFRATPLHPQWLLGRRRVPQELIECEGLVVDVGSADRWLSGRLAPGARYLAVDLPAPDGSVYAAAPDVFASADALPFGTGQVDALACFEVLEHVEQPKQVLFEAFRVLRSGGLYAVSTPFLYPLHDRPRDFRRYTPHGLEAEFVGAGFRVLAIRPMLGAIETAGLVAALAVAGGMAAGGWRWALLPIALPVVLAINLGCKLGGWVWPRWDGMAMGYEIVGRKP